MHTKRYEVTEGTPGVSERCCIVDEKRELYYYGYYDAKHGTWRLYSRFGTPKEHCVYGMIVSDRDVSWRKKQDTSVPVKKEEPERKRWRYPGDPDGQVGLLGEGVGK